MSARLEHLRTPRLRLDRPQPSDLAELCRMHADPVVMATLGGVRSEAATAELLRALSEHWERHGFGPWVLRAPEDGRSSDAAGCAT